MKRNRHRAQSILEYAVLIIVAVAALMSMRIFMTRAVQERYRQSADAYGGGEQYARGTKVTDLNGVPVPPPVYPPDPPLDTCSQIEGQVEKLEGEIKELRANAADFDKSADDAESSFPDIQTGVNYLLAKAGGLEGEATTARNKAAQDNVDADEMQAEIDGYHASYPTCFSPYSYYCDADSCSVYMDACCCMQERIAVLEPEIARLRQEAIDEIAKAEAKEAEAAKYRKQANDLQDAKEKLKEQIAALRAQAVKARADADEKEAKICEYKSSHPECVITYSGC